MDQAALQVLHHIKSDLDLFLIDFKYIKEVISTKLSDPVSPTEFNFVLSELSSVNASLRRPTIACICRASAVNIDSQHLRVNVDENFYVRFFKVFHGLNLSNEDTILLEKAHAACVKSLPVKEMENETSDGDDYYEKYNDEGYDDEDSQSKHTFENTNLNMASFVEDSLYSEDVAHIDGATTSKVFTASEYEDNTGEQTNFAVGMSHDVDNKNEKTISIKDQITSDSYYDDNDFEDSVGKKSGSLVVGEKYSKKEEKVTDVKDQTSSDSYYDDNDFEDKEEENVTEEEHQIISGAFVSAQYDQIEAPERGGEKERVLNIDAAEEEVEGSSSAVYYDNDFEDSPHIENSGQSPERFPKEQENSYYNDNDFEDKEDEVENHDTKLQTPETKLNASIVSNIDYDVSDFEDASKDESVKTTTERVIASQKEMVDVEGEADNRSEQSAGLSKSSKSGVVEVIKRNVILQDTNIDQELLQLQTGSGDDFDFPNMDTIQDSTELSTDSVAGKLTDLPAPLSRSHSESSPNEGKATKYGSMARRDSMLNFLNAFAHPGEKVEIESDDENENDKGDSEKVNDHISAHSSESSVDITLEHRAIKPTLLSDGDRKGGSQEQEQDNYSDEDGFYEDDGDDFEEPHVNYSPLRESQSINELNFSPEKEKSIPIPYPPEVKHVEEVKHVVVEKNTEINTKNSTSQSQRPLSANPSPSASLPGGGSTTVERPASAHCASPTKSNDYIATPISGNNSINGNSNNTKIEDSTLQPPALAPTTSSSNSNDNDGNNKKSAMEIYASKPRVTAMFMNHAKNTIQMAKFVSKFSSRPSSAHAYSPTVASTLGQRVRPQSAQGRGSPSGWVTAATDGPLHTPDMSMIERRLSPPKQVPIHDQSPLLVKTESHKQAKRPMSADNAFFRDSGTMVRSASAGTHRQNKNSIKYAERIAAAQLAAYKFQKKPPIPVHAFAGCVKPENKGHIFNIEAARKKPHIPLDAFANTVKPENPGHVFPPYEKPPKHPHLPTFPPPVEKVLPVVDEDKPVKNLMAFYRLIKNKIVIVEDTLKCVHNICKEETFKALVEKYADMEQAHEKELVMISRNSRKAISSNTTTLAKTIQNEVDKFKKQPQPGKRTFTQDHADRFRKFIHDSKEASFHHGRHCMNQATLRHEKELKALEASLREPTNRMRKYFEAKLLLLNQASLRNNIAYDHFKKMLDIMDPTNKETQQGRVHRAAVECHTILFCCLELVNEIDKEVHEINTKMEALMENEYETFNFSSTNSVHFFPKQFHQYFGNMNATPVSAAYAPKKLQKKAKLKHLSGKNQIDEEKEKDLADDVFLTQGSEDDRGENRDGEQNASEIHLNVVDDEEGEEDRERSNDDKHNPSLHKEANYNKQEVVELLATWLSELVDEVKSPDEWVDTAINVVCSSDSMQVLHSSRRHEEAVEVTPVAENNDSDSKKCVCPDLNTKNMDPTIACLAEWLSEGLHTQENSGNKSATQWIAAATKCVTSQMKTKTYKKKKKKKKELQPEPCTQCKKMYRGEGKTLPSRLSSGDQTKPAAKRPPTNAVHFLQFQKTQNFKFSKGRANEKLFCSWECTRQWNEEHTPVLYRYETEQLIRIAAGKFKLKK